MAVKKVNFTSASQIGQFLFCPLSYKYIYIDGAKKMPPTVYLLYGQAIHEALAHNFRQKIVSKEDLDYRDVYKKFCEIWDKDVDNVQKMAWDRPAAMRVTAENVLAEYMRVMAPTIQPVKVEYKFEMALKNYPVTIMGIIDLITDDDIIIDHKNIGKTELTSKDPKWTQKSVDADDQLTLYAAAFRKENGRAEKGVRIDILPRVDKPEFRSISSTRDHEQIDRLLTLAARIEDIVRFGVFIPNLAACDQCSFKDVCDKKAVLVK